MKQKTRESTKRIIRNAFIASAVAVCIVFANGCWYVFGGQFKSADKLDRGEELSLYECCSIYTMHMATWMFGRGLSRQAARECFRLHFPQRDTVRFYGGFRSEKLAEAAQRLKKKPYGSSERVTWDGNVSYGDPEEREAAIALNPCVLTREGYCDYKVFTDEVKWTITSTMLYPKRSETHFKLGGGLDLVLNEGLFRYLQDKGWLSSYVAEWVVCHPASRAELEERLAERERLGIEDLYY